MRQLIILLLVFISGFSYAQTSPYDEVSYELMISGQWKELLNVSEKAIREGYKYDYFFMRAGYAGFQLNKFMLSEYYYERALGLCHDTATMASIRQYLFWCHIYNGSYTHAVKQYEKMLYNKNAEQPSPAPLNKIHLLNAEYGMKFSSNTDLYKTLHYTQLGLGFRAGYRATGFVSASHLNQETYYGTLNQFQLYSSVTLPFRNQVSCSPAFHFIYYQHSNMQLDLQEKDFTDMPFVISTTFSKSHKKWRGTLSVSYATFNKKSQIQEQAGIFYYPFGNTRLETAINLTHVNNNGTDNLLYGGQVKFWPTQKVSFSANYLLANTNNFTEQNGWLATNAFDKTYDRVQLGAEYLLRSNLHLYAIWQQDKREEYYYKTNYTLNMALIGIKLIR